MPDDLQRRPAAFGLIIDVAINPAFARLIDEPWGRLVQDWTPSLDLFESGESYLSVMELPGDPVPAIEIRSGGNNVIISGTRCNGSEHATKRSCCWTDSRSSAAGARRGLDTVRFPSVSMKFDIAPVAYFSMEIGFDPQIPTYAGVRVQRVVSDPVGARCRNWNGHGIGGGRSPVMVWATRAKSVAQKTPTQRSCSSTTGTPLILWDVSTLAASAAGSCFGTVTASRVITSAAVSETACL